MPASASEIEKAESRAKAKASRQHAEECRLEAAGHCRKAHGSDPKKSIRECASEPGTSDKTPSGWVIKYGRTGKVTQARTGEQKELDEARKRIREPGSGFLKKPQPSSPGASERGQVPADAGGEGGLQRLDDGTRAGREQVGSCRWLKAGGSGEDPWGPLKEAIIEIWDASGRRFGFRKVWSKLAGDPKYGRFSGTTPCRVRRCMSELGITRHLPQCLQEDHRARSRSPGAS